MRYALAFLLLATLPASAQAPATITCPAGTVPNPSYAGSPMTQAPCEAVPPPAPVYVAPPAPVYVAPPVDPTLYWLQQQQLQQQQMELQRQHWQWEHMQHPDFHPDHH